MKTEINNVKSPEGITLVVGETGKTGRRVAERLVIRGVQTRIASRSVAPGFDWDDQGMATDGAITLPATDVPEPFVDVDDIADVVVAALTDDRHNSEVYEVTGPRMLTFAEVANEISHAAGCKVQSVQIPKEAFAASIAESGAPEDIAWLIKYLFETVLEGRNAYVSDGVRRALGREPKDFAEYARSIAASGLWKIAA